MRPADVVRSFFESMQIRDWDGAATCLSESVTVEFTETGERFHGTKFLAMNRAYPEGWTIEVTETIDDGERVAAQVRVDKGEDVFWCAGFYTVRDGMIIDGTEHWVTEGSAEAPEWRRPLNSDTGAP
jgi:ketosteroid isomerase-like protein